MIRVITAFLLTLSLLNADTIDLVNGGQISNCKVVHISATSYKVNILYRTGEEVIAIHKAWIVSIDQKSMNSKKPTLITGIQNLKMLEGPPPAYNAEKPQLKDVDTSASSLAGVPVINWNQVPMTILGAIVTWDAFSTAKRLDDDGMSSKYTDPIYTRAAIYLILTAWNGYFIFEQRPEQEKFHD